MAPLLHDISLEGVMAMVRATLILVLALVAVRGDAQPLLLTRVEHGASVAVAHIAAPRERVFAALSHPSRWKAFLSDAVQVEPHGPGQWRVTSRILGHAVVLALKTRAPSLVHCNVVDAGPGGALDIDIQLEDAPGRTTRIIYRLVTVLPLGLDHIVNDATLRRAREEKILADLADLERVFGALP